MFSPIRLSLTEDRRQQTWYLSDHSAATMTNIRRDSKSEIGVEVKINSAREGLKFAKEALMQEILEEDNHRSKTNKIKDLTPDEKSAVSKAAGRKRKTAPEQETQPQSKKRLFITPKSQRQPHTPEEAADAIDAVALSTSDSMLISHMPPFDTVPEPSEDDDDEAIWRCRLCGRRQSCLIDENGKDVMCACTPSFKILWEVNASLDDEVEEMSYLEDELVQEGAQYSSERGKKMR